MDSPLALWWCLGNFFRLQESPVCLSDELSLAFLLVLVNFFNWRKAYGSFSVCWWWLVTCCWWWWISLCSAFKSFSIDGLINVQGQIGDVPYVLFKNVAQMPTRVSLTLLHSGSPGEKVLRFIVSGWPAHVWNLTCAVVTCTRLEPISAVVTCTCLKSDLCYYYQYMYMFEILPALMLPVLAWNLTLFLPVPVLNLICAVVTCTCLKSYLFYCFL